MILIFFGPPGAGKGTQAQFISDSLKIPHLSTGEILRSQLNEDHDLSKKIKEIMDQGKYVSDQILNSIVSDRINKEDCLNGFILDGYPRTLEQAYFTEKIFSEKKINLSHIFDFYISEQVMVKRIIARSNSENRDDDNIKVVKTRISRYNEETKPVSNYYKKHYPSIYSSIMGDKEISELNKELLKLLKKE